MDTKRYKIITSTINQVFILVLWSAFCVIISSREVHGQTETYSWGNVPMGGAGFVTGIIPSKKEQGLVYARTDVGGAYRLDAATDTWIPLLDWVSDGELGFLGVESIAIDPVEANIVYMLVGTSYFNNGRTAILKSTDYGNTFSVIDVSNLFKAHGNGMGRQSGEKLVVDPNSTNILFCGTRANGLFKSVNAGVTWSRVSSLNITTTPNANGVSFVIMDPSSASAGAATQTIIAGISRTGSNLYRSNDGGATFTEITGGPSTLMPHRAVLASNGNLFITYVNNAGPWDISGAGQLWKYNLLSGAWTNVTVPGFAGAYGGISVDPANARRLVVSSLNSWLFQYIATDGVYGERIFLTTDGGATWTDVVARGFEMDPNGSPWINGHAIHWAGCVEFDPFDTKKAWVISGNGIFKTDDINATVNVWKFYVKGLEETVPLDIVSIPNGPLVSVIGDYDGFRHTDITQYGSIHTPRIGTTTSIASASLNPKVMLRIGSRTQNNVTSGVMYYSTDMGISWTACTARGPAGNLAISADGAVFLHTPENSSVTYRSSDNGVTWTSVTGLAVNNARPTADPVNPNKFYVYNNANGAFLVSTDKGVSFSSVSSLQSNGSRIIRLAPATEGDIWVALYNNGLSRSTASGQNFSSIAGVSYCGAVGFGKSAPGNAYPTVYIWGTVSSVLGIHRSTDKGVTWKRVNDNEHEYGGPGNGQFVTGDMNVYDRVYMSTAGRGIVYGESDQTCSPTFVVPHIQVNTEAEQQTAIGSLSQGSTVKLSPAPVAGGTWAWTGPGGFTSTDREVILSNIQGSQGGIYTVRYTNANLCESAPQTFAVYVSVKASVIIVKGQGDATSIDEKGGTLQMIAAFNPSNTTNQAVVWSITDGTEVASISSSGLLTALKDGTVRVRASAQDGSNVFGEADITITNQAITDVRDAVEVRLGIYPNPSYSSVTISNAKELGNVVIRNMEGQVILNVANANHSMNISLETLPAGIYLMECIDKLKKIILIRKIVRR